MGFNGIAKFVMVMAVLICVGSMFGCAASLQPKTLETGSSVTKELRVKTHDIQGQAIPETRVEDAIAAALLAGGKTPTPYEELFRSTYQGSSSYSASGIRVNKTTTGIEVEYLDGSKVTTNYSGPSYYQSRIAATFPLTVTKSEDGELYKAVLGFPAQVSMTPPEYNPFASPKYALPEAEVVPNLLTRFNAIDKVEIVVTAHITGEVTVDSAPDAVRGNLERILGKYQDWKSGYNFEVKGHTEPLSVKLFPYKSGCKMQYTVDLPYMVSETTSLTEADIEAVRRKIESVAKD